MTGIMILLAILAVGLLLVAVVSQSTKPSSKSGARSKNRTGSLDREFVARKWQTIESLTQVPGGNLREAVSEADKLLDYAMKYTGVRGETMGERLKNSGSRFTNVNAIWSAHKVRNALAHEAEFDLVPTQAREAVQSFRQGLKDLGAL